jgi:hypothetical protein
MRPRRVVQNKERLTVTVDPALVRAGNDAVAAGHAASLSSWVNLALAERAAKERHLRALARAVEAYEAKFGAISDDEMISQARLDKRAASPTKAPHRRRSA